MWNVITGISKWPLLAFVGVLCVMCARDISTAVREPAVAGQFYPADSGELAQMIADHLAKASPLPKIDGRIIALIVPHAGLVYSGPIAAYSYKLLEGSSVNKVILCGPSHRYRFDGMSVYGPGVQWRTPLGLVTCNDQLCRALVDKHKGFSVLAAAQAQEHSLEVQLPYLQTVLEDFTFVPITMGSQDALTIGQLAAGLEALPFDSQTILIAATDWQHYMPASVGSKLDSAGMECIRNLDPDRLEEYLATDKTQACGGGPMVAVIKAAMAKGANRALILKYGDSGDITGDKSSVVGYVAAVLYKARDDKGSKAAKEPEEAVPEKMLLTDADKQELLKIARRTIETYLKTGNTPDFGKVSENIARPGAAFVTLEKQGQLRGCIGQTVAATPLYQTVAYCAIQAAVDDPRFLPVTEAEFKDIHIEISVLTPLQRVRSFDEIKVGRDGLMIFKGAGRGLLLPQVATDYGWDRDEFLRQTCHKAGLPPEAYLSKDAEIYKFQAIIFGE